MWETETTDVRGGDTPPDPPAASHVGIDRGAILGRYTVLEAIGSGGMGNVFAAWDPELRRRVAIKVLHADLMRSQARTRAQDRLRREARAAARLAHPNVVAIYDVGTVGERLFVAMELLEGETLDTWSEQARPWQEVLSVYRQAGAGLAAAHRAGLVHRDFKPGNAMRSSDGRVKVLDFGLAKAIHAPCDDTGENGNTRAAAHIGDTTSLAGHATTGQVRGVGTPRFMSPEQRRGAHVDHRSDQFSFCLALHQALHGAMPIVPGEEHEPAAPLAAPTNGDVPAAIQRALERGLQPDPDDRFPTMDTLLDALRPASHRRLGWRIASALTAALAVLGWIGLRSQPAPCEAAGSQVETTWNDTRRETLGAVFATAGAAAAWPSIGHALDDRSEALRTSYAETCRATYVRHEQSATLLDRRMACLEDRRRSLGALLRLFEQERPEILARARAAVDGLPSLAACADRAALSDLPPPAAEARAQVEEVRRDLAEARALELAGRYGEAAPRLEAAVEAASATGYRPLLGEAQLLRAEVRGRLGDSGAMKDDSIEAASIALATGHRALLARSYLQLIVVGFLRGEVQEAQTFARMAEAAIEGLGGRSDLEAERLFFLGMIAIREARFTDAVDLYGRYLDLGEPRSPLERVNALNNRAESLRQLGELTRARADLVQALPLLDQLDPGHEIHATVLTSLGEIDLEQGDIVSAERNLTRGLEGMTAALGREHPKIGTLLQVLGRLYLRDGRVDRAVEVLERATTLHERTPGYEVSPTERRWLLGQALWLQGRDRQRALSLIRQAATADAPGERVAIAQAQAWLHRQGG